MLPDIRILLLQWFNHVAFTDHTLLEDVAVTPIDNLTWFSSRKLILAYISYNFLLRNLHGVVYVPKLLQVKFFVSLLRVTVVRSFVPLLDVWWVLLVLLHCYRLHKFPGNGFILRSLYWFDFERNMKVFAYILSVPFQHRFGRWRLGRRLRSDNLWQTLEWVDRFKSGLHFLRTKSQQKWARINNFSQAFDVWVLSR